MSRPTEETAQVARARATLERLQDDTATADPYDLAPLHYIADLHEVLASIPLTSTLGAYRLDGLHGINMRFLHARVGKVLHDLDGLVATNLAPRGSAA